ncbi:alpha/beta fold hydrolase [Bradyrhizobium sp. BR13661]|jgi:esterase/lipase superfamily enzyme|uniref:alpha/beta hydrolase n=1 Tax=Bradyrhizobium sp. BR13661 TaxID=2940622 RepID=UPI002476ADEE|nr:alpha/beta fold hydrolase [Bradyrhizobium sp. BR13661]MDH6263642.1 esterase/lipase superfamily enzyme [Bradyrhizobium sp. BR13661]
MSTGIALRLGLVFGILTVAATIADRGSAQPAASQVVTAEFCKKPASAAAVAETGGMAGTFMLRCGARVSAGTFLGAFNSPAEDAVGDCVKRCTADGRCQAFTLSSPAGPMGRFCALYSVPDGYVPTEAWVSGVRIAALPAPGDSPSKSAGSDPKDLERMLKLVFGSNGLFSDNGLPSGVGAGATTATRPAESDLPPLSGVVPTAPPIAPGGDVKALQPVYYATDRQAAAQGTAPETAFTTERSKNISYGVSIVSIPKNHTIGNVERPHFSILKLGREKETDADHFRIKSITPLDRAAFVTELKGGAESVLLFIHGYNVPFADAIFKAAQIAYDANFPGSVLLFSWPSAGELAKYEQDRESAQFAVPHLAQILTLLSGEIGKKDVYVVAHSMGNQVLVDALVQSALAKANLTINELVMAAPDVDRDVFASKADQFRSIAKYMTLYASASDKALLASGRLSFGTRLGYVGPGGPNIFPGVDVIDVTAVGDDMFGLDHGTFSGSRAVLDDLGRLIRSVTHLKPNERTPTLRLMPDQAHVQYWLYPR